MRAIALIPARGGSKRLPRKNVLAFRGRPMIAWSVAAALETDMFDAVIVSTDDAEIADAGRDAGADVVARAPALAGDDAPIYAVLLDFAAARPAETYAVLMANCPLRTAVEIRAVHGPLETHAADGAMSVVGYGWTPPDWALRRDGVWIEPVGFDRAPSPTERTAPLACPSGAVRWIRRDALAAGRSFYSGRVAGVEIAWHRGVDIDTAEDYEAARLIAHALDNGFKPSAAPAGGGRH